MKTVKMKKWLFLLGFLMVAGLIYILNWFTQLYQDDFSYFFSIITGERIKTVKDIIDTLPVHYNTTNGRPLAIFLMQFFLLLGKPLFNVINTAAFLLLIVLINYHASGSFRKIKISFLISSFLFIWFCSPGFGQGYLWVTGAANYLYIMLIILLYLVPYRRVYDKGGSGKGPIIKESILLILSTIGGVIAGWSQENAGAALFFILLGYLVYFIHKKISIRPWMASGFAGVTLGLFMMATSPANANRTPTAGRIHNVLVMLIYNFCKVSIRFFQYFLPIIILFIVLCLLFIANKKEKGLRAYRDDLWLPGIYLLGTLASMYSMILAPYLAPRACTGPIILGVITVGTIWCQIKLEKPVVKMGVNLIIFVSFLSFLSTYSVAILELRVVRQRFLEREAIIQESKDNGIYDVLAPAIGGNCGYNYYEGYDLSYDSEKWPNTSIARYYGLDSITAAPNSRDSYYPGFSHYMTSKLNAITGDGE